MFKTAGEQDVPDEVAGPQMSLELRRTARASRQRMAHMSLDDGSAGLIQIRAAPTPPAYGRPNLPGGTAMIDLDQSELLRVDILRKSGLLAAAPMPELDELCRQARDRFGVRTVLVTLVGEHWQVVLASSGGALRQTPRSAAFCDHTFREDAGLVVPDATRDPRFARNPLVTGWPFLRFYAGAPLIFARGAKIGSLCLLDTEPHELTPTEMEELALTAERVTGLLLERAYETRFEQMIA